jgi:hypothetical protein
MRLQGALRLLYPPACITCGASVTEDHALCATCWRDTPFIAGTVCDQCGTPLPSDGFHDWTFTGRWLPGWLAIFSRAEPNPSDGSGYTRRQPTGGGNHHWISAIDDGSGGSSGDFRGSGLHAAFNLERPRLGPDTNPMAEDLVLEVLEQQGNLVRFSVRIVR